MATSEKGKRTHEAIRESARRVIAAKGFFSATVAEITELAGKSPGSFYNYYPSKEALLGELADEFRHEFRNRLAPLYVPGVDPSVTTENAVRQYWAVYQERLAEMVGIFQLAMINEEFAVRWQSIQTEVIDGLADGIRKAQEDGYARGLDPLLTASALNASIRGFCYTWLAQSGDVSVALDEDGAIRTLAIIWYHSVFWTESPIVDRRAGG
jgi:AcrR family transcriptional regulator